jgi:membrane protein DedA with SNARE-associated domain/membrane-associated phospholipid phosphatase
MANWLRENRGDLAVAAVVAAVFVGINLILPSINAQRVLHDISTTLGAATYPLAFLAAFLETGAFVGLILPGETAVILAGAVAGQGATSIEVTIAVVWVGAFAGDSTSFWIGRKLGRGFVLRHGGKLRITESRLETVEGYYERYGGRTIIIGRFIGLVRALAPFVAGTSGWRYRDYFAYGLIGTLLWAIAFCLVGFYASQHIDDAVRIAGRATFVFGILVAGGVVTYLLVRYLRRADAATLRRCRSAALAAAVVAGLAAVVVLGVIVGGSPGPTGLDRSAFSDAAALQADWLVSAAKVVTALGSAWVIVPLAVVAAVVLARRRRWGDVAVLAVAVTLTIVATDTLKALIDRPRPAGSLVDTIGSAYPSGHAAHSILYPFIALIAVAIWRPSAKWATALIGAGVATALLVGLTRVYLRAHYMTDVLGGWGLGAAAFAGCAAIALVVAHLRQNSGDDVAAG